MHTATTTTTALRRASTQASSTSTTTTSRSSRIERRSIDSRIMVEDVLKDGDLIGPGRCIMGEPVSVVHARTDSVAPPNLHLRVIRKLGTGSYAVVYLVQEMDMPDPRYYAVKCLAKHAHDQDAQLLEATIHQSLPVHDNVVTLWTTLETASYLLLVLDYVPGEDLFYFLEQTRDYSTPGIPTLLASLPPNQLLSHARLRLVASMFSQMCDAVAHCHRNGIFHRDIKPENFMVTDGSAFNSLTQQTERTVSVKLTDFGLATRDVESGDMDCGSAPYMSYECHNNITPTYATAPADVWSLGIVLINMLYHANPWLSTASGHCQSFDCFLREPIPFFMDRFPGMTPAVAEFFARRVFCILEVSGDQTTLPVFTNVGDRITADLFGKWARDLPLHLGPAARRTPALAFRSLDMQPPSPPSSSPQTPTNANKQLSPSISQPGTRTPSPSYCSRPSPSIETQVTTTENNRVTDLASEDEEEHRDGRSRTTSSGKRRKRAPRGKSQSTSQPFNTPPTTAHEEVNVPTSGLSSAALYAASILAEKSQIVAREASAMKVGRTPPTSYASLTPTTATATATATASAAPASAPLPNTTVRPSITLNAKRSTPELRTKKSAKWAGIFKRDSGSDQEVPTADEVAAMDQEEEEGPLSHSPIYVTASPVSILPPASEKVQTATAKNISNLVMGLDSTSPPPSVHTRDTSGHSRSSSFSARGRRKTRGDRDSHHRDLSPGSLMSVSTSSTGLSWGRNRSAPSSNVNGEKERRARSKSPAQTALEEFNMLRPSAGTPSPSQKVAHLPGDAPPPVPVVPEPYRAPHYGAVYDVPSPSMPDSYTAQSTPSSSRRSYAPSIASVSTATTSSSAFTAFSGKKRWTANSSNSSRYSPSVHSVSTVATSLSSDSGSWRVGASGKKASPPPLPATNIKQMDGIPPEVGRLPRPMAHRPKEHKSSPAPKSQNRRRPPSAPTSPTPGSSFGLDTISEGPKKKKSAMKPRRTPNLPSQGFDQDIGVIGDRFYGNGSGPMGEFGRPAKSFGAGRGIGLAHVDIGAANAYLSGGVATNGMAIHSTDGIVTLPATEPALAKPPKAPTMSRLWHWRK